ncbi:hypothetical protein ABH926_000897 [Catenulispora sp. GP43]
MDDFEQDLIQMLRQPLDPQPFEPRHRERLWAAVRARRRARVRRIVAGSVVAAAACAVGLVLLPRAVDAGPRPTIPPATSVPTPPLPSSLPQTPPASGGPTASATTVSQTPTSPPHSSSGAIGMTSSSTSSTTSSVPTSPTTTTATR